MLSAETHVIKAHKFRRDLMLASRLLAESKCELKKDFYYQLCLVNASKLHEQNKFLEKEYGILGCSRCK